MIKKLRSFFRKKPEPQENDTILIAPEGTVIEKLFSSDTKIDNVIVAEKGAKIYRDEAEKG